MDEIFTRMNVLIMMTFKKMIHFITMRNLIEMFNFHQNYEVLSNDESASKNWFSICHSIPFLLFFEFFVALKLRLIVDDLFTNKYLSQYSLFYTLNQGFIMKYP